MHMDFLPTSPAADEIEFNDFLKVDIRVGTIVGVEEFPQEWHAGQKADRGV